MQEHLGVVGDGSGRQPGGHDALTRLPNRESFTALVEGAIRRSEHRHRPFAMACVDLNGFKAIHSLYGDVIGDGLLTAMAARLRYAVRGTDTIVRIGGDEFVLLLENIHSSREAAEVAERALHQLGEPVVLARGVSRPVEVRCSASIGVAVYPDHASRATDLMSLADAAMCAAKRAGGGARMYESAGRAQPKAVPPAAAEARIA